MPIMDWEAFQDSHYRPHLVVVDLPKGLSSRGRRSTVAFLERLAERLSLAGSYAIRAEPLEIKVVFESDLDAARFAETLRAHASGKGAEWASILRCRLDSTAQRRVSLRGARWKFIRRSDSK